MTEKISQCRACASLKIKPFFDLGWQALANSLLESPAMAEETFPLSLSWCADCSLVQLNHTVDSKKLFSKYVWLTGTSRAAREFAYTFAAALLKRTDRIADGYILEIASNDGTFLKPFMEKGYKVLGIDPAKNIVAMAEASGIPTKSWFFGAVTAQRIVQRYGFPKIILARNVLPHVAKTRDFVAGLKVCLSDGGLAAVEVHYAKIIQQELHYDSIYHEHLCYFTVKSLENLLNSQGLFIADIEQSPISGGSIIVYIKNHRTKESPKVSQYRASELKNKINEFISWQNFANRAYAHRKALMTVIDRLKARHQLVIGYGASARSSTLLNFCGIDAKFMPVIADQNPLKRNKFTAGSHIKIVAPASALKRRPDYVFILAWNFADEIRDILKNEFDYRGKYIMPLPNKPRVQ